MAQIENFVSLKESVLQRIRRDIVTCVLAPGTVIRDNELVERYKVSTSPIREALVQLSIERLVEMPPNRLKRVSPLDVKSAKDFFAVYKLVALAGFVWGAPHITREHLSRMNNAYTALGPALATGNRFEIVSLLRSFFIPVYEASHNRDLIETVGRRLNWLDRLVIVLGPHREPELLDILGELIDRLRAGDFSGAIQIHYELVHGLESDIERLAFIDVSSMRPESLGAATRGEPPRLRG